MSDVQGWIVIAILVLIAYRVKEVRDTLKDDLQIHRYESRFYTVGNWREIVRIMKGTNSGLALEIERLVDDKALPETEPLYLTFKDIHVVQVDRAARLARLVQFQD